MSSSRPISLAVVTGGHAFDVPGLHRLFRGIPGVLADFYSMEDWVVDVAHSRDSYDVVLFYYIQKPDPVSSDDRWADMRGALESLRTTGQGILVMHHGLLAFPDWPTWSEIVGIHPRTFGTRHDVVVPIHVENADHPITEGVSDWQMVDETYIMAEPDADSEVVLTTSFEESMSAIGWTRSFGASRVFCLQSGHNATTYGEQSFVRVLANAIRWLSERDRVTA
jgi:type 1 glutamine amidotransferase